jgi:lipoprotein signal peptidase
VTNNVARVGRPLLLIASTAAITGALALAHTGVSVSTAGTAVPAHERPALYVVGISIAMLAWAAAIVLTRSAAIAIAGGILAGGAVANVLSLALWPSVGGVPNPLRAGDVAFNVGDVLVAAGLALVLVGVAVHAALNRERLREPVRLGRLRA